MRQEDKSLDSLRFEHVNTHPRIAREGLRYPNYTMPVRNHYPGNGVYRYPGKSIGRPNPGKI